MRVEQKSNVKNSIGKLLFAAIAVLLQILWFMLLGVWLYHYSIYISAAASVLAFIIVVKMYGRAGNSSIKISWIIAILTFPILGLILYLLLGRPDSTKAMRRRFEEIDKKVYCNLSQDMGVMDLLEKEDLAIANQARYLSDFCGFPVYDDTKVTYYGEAKDGLEAQKDKLKKAKKFIFMEYHAIEDEESFKGLFDILCQKAREGVEVRVLYDDMGSIFFINKEFNRKMEACGIACRSFNPVVPVLRLFMNNRDHRKITVIDGHIGFTGGYNLADEYFNIIHPYGYWKDTGIQLEGEAVKNMTAMFLEMWNSEAATDTDFDKYINACAKDDGVPDSMDGFVLPYADSPLDGEHVGENVYLNMIKNAKRYVYIITPYLIITDEMNRELGMAAKRGVDVRIVTPGIPDKKVIYQVTRSYYGNLVVSGVRIYEYTPGFCHAKMCICDDEIGTVGTINFDYRSLYHHFENGVLIYKSDALKDIYQDMVSTMEVSCEVTDKYNDRSKALKIGQCILRIFAPLF